MKIFWKRLEAWVTELRSNPFTRTRLQLTLLYTIIIVSAVVFYLVIQFEEFTREAMVVSKEIPDTSRRQKFIQRSTRVARTALFGIQVEDVLIFFATIGISYSLAGVALKPVKKVVENQKHFMAEVSHELRIPLSIIKTDMEVFLHQDIKDFASKKDFLFKRKIAVSSNLNEIERIQLILDNLLFLSREDTYQETFVAIPFFLNTVVSQAIARLRDFAHKKQIELVIRIKPKAFLYGDPVRIEQAIINILKNAIKYTGKGGKITVEVIKSKLWVKIVISDTGVGIAEKDLPHVYQRFFRGENKDVKQTEGIGLGLTITKMIIEKHKGKIHIDSVLGKGTTVVMTLPISKKAHPLYS